MQEYFQKEMRLLNEGMQEFSRSYPEYAGQLNLDSARDRDPNIERLLEGAAYLTAQIKQQIDDGVPQISESLLRQFCPTLLRPIPSMCIMQFQPRVNQLYESVTINKGAVISSGPVGKEHEICHFKTTSCVKVNPLQISEVDLASTPPEETVLKIKLKTENSIPFAKLDLEKIKIFLNDDPINSVQLYHFMTNEVDKIRISFPEEVSQQKIILGDQSNILPAHLETQNMMLPDCTRTFTGYQLIQEFFVYRRKYLFVILEGLDQIGWPENCEECEIEIFSNSVLDFIPNKNNLRLHCAPAINLFKHQAEPTLLDHKRTEYPIILDFLNNNSALYQVAEVVGIEKKSQQRIKYHDLHVFDYRENNQPYYSISQRKINATTKYYVSFGNIGNIQQQYISLTIDACNGDLPSESLAIAKVNIPGEDIPAAIKVENLTRPSKMLPPPPQLFQWQLIANLALNYQAISNVDSLKQLLAQFNWPDDMVNKQYIESIVKVSTELLNKVKRGVLLQGLRICIDIAEKNYGSIAEVYLFGTMLHQLFKTFVAVNQVVETTVICKPSDKELQWPATHGNNILI